nr:PREDICTED: mucin-4-like isoform X2 [Latimeria chalumnae]|eukprot:XP_014348447.1 PREDICTED: mucin-4-like isoform X2 [Latimeria chalumnae]
MFTFEILPLKNTKQVTNLRILQANGKVFQSVLPNKFSAGKRCTYCQEDYLIAGNSERFFIHTENAAGVQDHIDKDLLPFEWCCNKTTLCHLYYEKRPSDTCKHYSPPAIGQIYGSLHFKTFDGVDYSFKGLGEYVIVRISSLQGFNVFTLQGQTDVLETSNGYSRVTAFKSFAAFYQGTMKVEWRLLKTKKALAILVEDKVIDLTSGKALTLK